MPRIIIAADTFPPHTGGSEQLLGTLADSLSSRAEVVVYTPASVLGHQSDREFDSAQGYSIIRSRWWAKLFRQESSHNPLISRNARLLTIFLTYTKLVELCRGADLLIIGHALPLGAVATALQKRNPKLKTLLITYGEEIVVYSRGDRMKRMLKQVLETVNATTVLTPAAGDRLNQLATLKRPPHSHPSSGRFRHGRD